MKRKDTWNLTDKNENQSMEALLELGRSLHSQAVYAALMLLLRICRKKAVATDNSSSKGSELDVSLNPVNTLR